MINKPALTMTDVEILLSGAKAEALKNKWAVSIAVVDDGGHLLGLLRMDHAPVFTAQMASEKARTAALGRRESKMFEEIISAGRLAFLSAPGMFALLEGGVPVLHDGVVAGAIGASGVKSAEDAQIVKAGIAALIAQST